MSISYKLRSTHTWFASTPCLEVAAFANGLDSVHTDNYMSQRILLSQGNKMKKGTIKGMSWLYLKSAVKKNFLKGVGGGDGLGMGWAWDRNRDRGESQWSEISLIHYVYLEETSCNKFLPSWFYELSLCQKPSSCLTGVNLMYFSDFLKQKYHHF